MSIGSGVPIAIEPGQIAISAAFANGRIPTFFLTELPAAREKSGTSYCVGPMHHRASSSAAPRHRLVSPLTRGATYRGALED